ncbi:MAG TPA: GNAT family N-acetyltransferase [Candidatus Polarisedimenticolia bacterium]|nr:GNAT family N-acetyltransferase [Candidatus Polarisedimenticolia bacterium]
MSIAGVNQVMGEDPERTRGGAEAMNIRRASEADLPGVTECLAAAFEDYRGAYTEEAYRDTVLSGTDPQRRFREMTVLVAEDAAGRIVGTVAYRLIYSGEGHVRGMGVRPDQQGSGLAGRLLAAAEQGLREQGCLRVTLNTTEVLERARKFYRQQGYGTTGIVHDFYGMPLIEHDKTL